MADFSTLRYEVDEGLARITLARPDKRNAMNDVLFAELGQAAEQAAGDPAVRAILVAGKGKTFCAGIDLGMFGHEAFGGGDRFGEFVRMAQRGYRALQTAEKPSVAAVQGHAVGAGFQLALACDLRVVTEDAVFGMFEIRYGIIPDLGGNRPLTLLVGPARAKELVWTGRTVDAAEAERIGLANAVVGPDALAKEAEEIARQLAAAPPLPVAITRSLIDNAASRSPEESMDAEGAGQRRAVESADHREAVAAFLEKRLPKYSGR